MPAPTTTLPPWRAVSYEIIIYTYIIYIAAEGFLPSGDVRVRSRKSRLYRNNTHKHIVTTTTIIRRRAQAAAPRCGGGSITRVDKTSQPTPETRRPRRRRRRRRRSMCRRRTERFRYSTVATATELVRPSWRRAAIRSYRSIDRGSSLLCLCILVNS